MDVGQDRAQLLGSRLRRARLAASCTQEDLAERTGLSVRAISDLERGRTRRPYPRTIRRVVAALRLPDATAAELVDLYLTARTTPPESAEMSRPAAVIRPVPQQLPAEVRHFVGRVQERQAMTELLDEAGDTVAITAVGGMAGIGKTALSVCWAHQVAARFPDGQLYVNLRGYDAGDPVPATDALAGFLRALGVDGRDIPPDPQERAARYRSLLAGRRVLVILDNAREASQVRLLLPGTAGCAAVVTSRDSLAGLVARDGAARLVLDVLPPDTSVALLRRLIGTRVAESPKASAALAARCCGLPLALRVAAELAAARPAIPVAALADELTELLHRLDVLDAGGDEGTAVRAVFSWSYRYLEAGEARAFRFAALHPGTDLDGYALAALLDTDAARAGRLLERLGRAHLIHRTGTGRYGMHDLLRGYARELLAAEDRQADRDAAVVRLFDYYLCTAAAAMDTLFPAEAGRRPQRAPYAGALAPVHSPDAALAWLDAERANLIATAVQSADHGPAPAHAIALSATAERYFTFGHHLPEAFTLHGCALRAARRRGDQNAVATALTHLGVLEWERGRNRRAAGYQRQALTLFRATGNRVGLCRALHRLALVERYLGNLDRAVSLSEGVLELCRSAGDRLGQARALQSLGAIRRAQGGFTEATELFQQVLALLDELGDWRSRSITFQELGALDLRFGRLDSAEKHFEQAMRLCREAGNRSGETGALSQLGLLHLHRDDHPSAIEYQQRALAGYRQLGDRHGESEVLVRLGQANLQAGRTQQALDHLEHALELARALDARLVWTAALNTLGETLLATGRERRAATRFTAALNLADRTGDRDQQARAHDGLARAHTALGDDDQAHHHERAAATLYAALGLPTSR